MQHSYCFATAALLLVPVFAHAQTERVVGVIADGPAAEGRASISIEAIEQELRELVGSEFDVSFPASKRVDGGWTEQGIAAAAERLLGDPEVDVILATGLVAGGVLDAVGNLPKPVVVAVVADADLQDFPIVGDESSAVSGKENFVYVSDFGTVDDEITSFHEAVGFEHLAVLLDALTYDAITTLREEKADELEQALDIRISIVPVTDSATAALDGIPADADAVYVTPLLRLSDSQMAVVAAGLIERDLTSFSLIGEREVVQYGFLMSTSGRDEDSVRLTRRLALNLQRIFRGEPASEIEVSFLEPRRRLINMETADAIGFIPSYSILTDAEQYPDVPIEAGEPLSLAMAMQEAVDANLDLKVASFDPLISREGIETARAALRPQLGFGLDRVTIDADRANPLIQAERSTAAQLAGSQIIYSDDSRARLRLAEHVANAAAFGYETAVLDTMQSAATAYLVVLRARALEAVQRDNLEVTRGNREMALIRERVGFSGPGDRLRWESQLATDLQNVIVAESERRGSLVALNRILNRPQNQDFTSAVADIAQSMGIFDDEQFQQFIDNERAWETFQDFSVDSALRTSPELQQFDAFIAAQERAVLASERKRWLPEFTLGGTRGTVLNRSGAGSDLTGLGLDDESWSIALSAELPVFTSGALRSRVNTARYELDQLRQSRAALAEALEARTRLALQRASGTYPAIAPAEDARSAAADNLRIVTDEYSQGAASVTELVDAQNAANVANLRFEDTRYAALIDIIDVFRSSADFSIFLDPGSVSTWYQRVNDYFSAQGVEPPR